MAFAEGEQPGQRRSDPCRDLGETASPSLERRFGARY
jgi:hypothetical protein